MNKEKIQLGGMVGSKWRQESDDMMTKLILGIVIQIIKNI